jgi:hypothetical protein
MDNRLTKALEDLRNRWLQVETDEGRRNGLIERLDRVSLLVAYQGFDLEATRRENAALRRAATRSRHRPH